MQPPERSLYLYFLGRELGDAVHKNLLGVPCRIALAPQDDGWIVRSAIV